MSKKNRRQYNNRYQDKNRVEKTQGLPIRKEATSEVTEVSAMQPVFANQKTPYFSESKTGKPLIQLNDSSSCELANIPAYLLETDPLYQRETKQNHVDEIVAAWDDNIMNVPKVSYRDGRYFVFDGAHTVGALTKINGHRDFLVPCFVYHGLTWEDEAYLFVQQKGVTQEIAFAYKLRAALGSKERTVGEFKDVHAFKACIEYYGFELPIVGENVENALSATKTAYRMFQRIGEEKFGEVLSLICDTWGYEKECTSRAILEGVCRFLSAYRHMYNRKRFIRDLSQKNVTELARRGRNSVTSKSAAKTAQLILESYNRKGGIGVVPTGVLMSLENKPYYEEISYADVQLIMGKI